MSHEPPPEVSRALEQMIARDERAFAAYIRTNRRLGYGRMMQIISHLWYQDDPHGALTTGPCYSQLPPARRRTVERQAQTDPVCKEQVE